MIGSNKFIWDYEKAYIYLSTSIDDYYEGKK